MAAHQIKGKNKKTDLYNAPGLDFCHLALPDATKKEISEKKSQTTCAGSKSCSSDDISSDPSDREKNQSICTGSKSYSSDAMSFDLGKNGISQEKNQTPGSKSFSSGIKSSNPSKSEISCTGSKSISSDAMYSDVGKNGISQEKNQILGSKSCSSDVNASDLSKNEISQKKKQSISTGSMSHSSDAMSSDIGKNGISQEKNQTPGSNSISSDVAKNRISQEKNQILGSKSCSSDVSASDLSKNEISHKKNQSISIGPVKRLEDLLGESGNRICADCGSPDPKWVSLNIGVFICIKCSGVHRSLGVHISKVLSLKLDDWSEEEVDSFINIGGNTAANMKYEASLPENIEKPHPDSPIEERSDFIRKKYELQQFSSSNVQTATSLLPSSSPSCQNKSLSNNPCSPHDKKLVEKQHTSRGLHSLGQAFRNSWRRREAEHKAAKKNNLMPGMVEFVGLIKVNVVRGTNLAVRDVLSSDPYVVLSLGHQSLRTRVIKNNLNPVWNESLMLSIPDPIPPLKLQVYDKDTFTTDDQMGQYEIDIQPLLSAAKAHENTSITESKQLEKWAASKDNTLVKDSVITLVNGKVQQQISIRLQNVERGELEVELECVPLSQ